MEKSIKKAQNKVVLSKSSNSALLTNPTGVLRRSSPVKKSNNTKTRSNAEFQPYVVKKRGMYVENKPTKLSLKTQSVAGTSLPENKVKPPPRPGRKRFLASVLTILSKATTGTQYPDKNEPKRFKKKIKKPIAEADNEFRTKPTPRPNNNKYKSKALNKNKTQIDKFEVIQKKKELVQTPSLISFASCEDKITVPENSELAKTFDDFQTEEGKIVNNLVKQIEEGRKVREKTLQKDVENVKTECEANEDKKLYNFFVDLLESTLNVYKVSTDKINTEVSDKNAKKAILDEATVGSTASSNVAFEIDETVAKKLIVEKPEAVSDTTSKPSKVFFNVASENNYWDNNEDASSYSKPAKSFSLYDDDIPYHKKKRNETYKKNRVAPPPMFNNDIFPQKSVYKTRKSRKTDLLNILREELKMDDYRYEEPRNMFQALSFIAKSKRKVKKGIRFDDSVKKPQEKSYSGCAMNRERSSRNIVKPDGLKPRFKKQNSIFQSEYNTEEDLSNHSIEVYGYEYDFPVKNYPGKRKKEVSLMYHSSDSRSANENENNCY